MRVPVQDIRGKGRHRVDALLLLRVGQALQELL